MSEIIYIVLVYEVFVHEVGLSLKGSAFEAMHTAMQFILLV